MANDLELRLGFSGDINKIIIEATKYFSIGKVINSKYLSEGYEDYNIKIITEKGIYILKLFSNNQLGDYSKTRRGVDVVERLVEILLQAQKLKLNSPRLCVGIDKNRIFRSPSGMVGILYTWIDGETFYNLDEVPNENELESVISQIAKFNTIDFKPVFYLDIWAVIHIEKLYEKVEKHLSKEDRNLINDVLDYYNKIDFEKLPKCLVHGDLTKGNVLKTPSGIPYIIDFSVSNWTYRIIEIALIASNLMFDPNNISPLRSRVDTACKIYQKYDTLLDVELTYVYNIAVASTAMELLGSRWRQEFLNDDSVETKFWLNLGRQSLKDAM